MLFPNVLVMLSASPRMSGFIYQVSCYMSPTSVHALGLFRFWGFFCCLLKMVVNGVLFEVFTEF